MAQMPILAMLASTSLLSVILVISLYRDASGHLEYRNRLTTFIATELAYFGVSPTLYETVREYFRNILHSSLRISPAIKSLPVNKSAWARQIIKKSEKISQYSEYNWAQVYKVIDNFSADPRKLGSPSKLAQLALLETIRDSSYSRVTDREDLVGENLNHLIKASKGMSTFEWVKHAMHNKDYATSPSVIIGPLTKFLDYVGRGTSIGLLAGLLADNTFTLQSGFSEPGQLTVWGPIMGGILGGTAHGASLNALMSKCYQGPKRRNWYLKHPIVGYFLLLSGIFGVFWGIGVLLF